MTETALRDQLTAAATAALVVDETDAHGVLVVRGGDRRTWLNGLVTCDMNKLAPGTALYGLAVTPKGRVLSDMVFVEHEDRVLVVLPLGEVQAVAQAFDHYLVMEDAELQPAAEAVRVLVVHGPRSANVLTAAAAAGAVTGALDRYGLGGGLVVAESAVADAVHEAVVRAARDAGGMVADSAAAEALRLEQGVPRFGVDFGASTYPQEAGLESRAVSFDKGCYLGQEVVCMLQLRGHVKRKLVSIAVDEGTVSAGAPIAADDGQAIGELTSVTESPTLGRPIALGMVKLAFADPGTPLRVAGARAHVIAAPIERA